MHALAYVSKSQMGFDQSSLDMLAERSNRQNYSLGITGYLCYTGELFLQYLEGPEAEVAGLMERIEDDPRHRVIEVVKLGNIGQRTFPDWSMRYLRKSEWERFDFEKLMLDMLEVTRRPHYRQELIQDFIIRIVRRISETKSP
ncbi:MAG TPA: BLUF domain-containing protein [Calditrichia bacterium]|nr:BLUF domain-containing protein [Calditrichota bacterium]HQU70710.1 BLUF domain-containing protein [Calditrichia bacterium]HQV31822.1 BLUF domain-containing protein [Calditrichia bacterium]